MSVKEQSALLGTSSAFLAGFFLRITQSFSARLGDDQGICAAQGHTTYCSVLYLSLVWTTMAWFVLFVLSTSFRLREPSQALAQRCNRVLFAIGCLLSALALNLVLVAPTANPHDNLARNIALISSIVVTATTLLFILGVFWRGRKNSRRVIQIQQEQEFFWSFFGE